MSEKIDRRWRINSRAVLEVLYEGRWETAGTRWTYPDNGHNQRFAEAVADACGDIDALTSERDEAVRVAGELRAKAAEVANIWRYREDLMETDRMTLEQAMNGWLARYDSLTASTGGSVEVKDEEES